MGDEESQSRVEKLLALLKCKNEVVRELACANLGDACVNDAAVFESLLKRIHELLVGKQWDVRESAAQAIRQLARVSLGKCSSASPAGANVLDNKFKFDLKSTLAQGCALLSCDESEYNCAVRESQDHQMRIVKQQLMIGGEAVGELNVSEFLSTSDFELTSPSVENAEAVAVVKKPKLDVNLVNEPVVFSCVDEEGRLFLSIVCRFCETLCSDLYKPDWTVRHGAALGLRQLLTVVPFSLLHQNILRHMFVVLALDRFSDFVGSQVVAPVRETICQAVGVLTSQAPVEMRVEFFDVVLQFLQLDTGHEWSCRYAGLLAAKYMLIAYYGNGGEGQRSVPALPEKLIRALLDCLNDDNEDVVIAAAEAISGVVEKLLETAPVFSSDLVSRCQSRLANYINDDSNASLKGLLHILHCCPTFRIDLLSLAVYNSFLDHSIADIRRLYLSLAVKSVEMTPETVLAENAAQILGAFLPSLFTKALVEPDEQVFATLRQFWCSLVEKMDPILLLNVVYPMISYWMAMLMVPWTNPMLTKEYVGSKRCVFLAGDGVLALPLKERRCAVLQVKRRAAGLLAVLLKCISRVRGDEQSAELRQSVPMLFQFYLESNSIDQQSAACLTLCEWAAVDDEFGQFSNDSLREKLHLLAETELVVYDETVGKLTQLNSLCSELETLVEEGLVRPESPAVQSTLVAFSPTEAVQRCLSLMATLNHLPSMYSDLQHRGESLQEQILSTAADLQSMLQEVKVLTCCACVLFGQLPARLNPLIKPLMEYVRQSDDGCLLIDQVACCLSRLLLLCKDRTPSPNMKIVKNLATLLGAEKRLYWHSAGGSCRCCCILSRKRVRDFGQQLEYSAGELEEQAVDFQAAANASKVLLRVVNDHQHRLAEVSTSLYDILFNPMPPPQPQPRHEQQQSVQLMNVLMTIKTVYACLEENIRRDLCQRMVPVCCELLSWNCCVLRQTVCSCLTVFAESDLVLTLNLLLPNILPKLESAQEGLLKACLGSVEVIYCLVQSVGHRLNGVIRILASAILPKMMVSHRTIRECACECFGSLVQLMPLEGGEGALQGLCPELIALQEERCQFFSLLCNPAALPLVKLPSILEGELRPYQKEGVTWLAFLKNYSLHGILSDEMGLGKTLQTLCILYMAQRMGSNDNNNDNDNKEKVNSSNSMSLILCPKTLVKHWVAEASKFFGHCTADFCVTTLDFDNVEELKRCNVLVASYESLRRENELLFDKHWLYCILDEGHVIRNHKTQLFKAALQIHAEHRLILTGTPVQNSVGELWSLFEFLMPGYLGTLQQFQQRYLKPICQSRDSKATSAEAHAGKKALEDLHKQVLPFILRRKKVDVCRDLPPKIIQDYYCSLSPVQQELYQAYSDAVQEKVASAAAGRESRKGITFSILTYLRKLCSHPLLVADSEPELMRSALDKLQLNDVEQLNDVCYSGKMQALKQLLSECSIGISNLADCDAVESNGISAHRALIFCQYKSALNLLCTFFAQGYFGKGMSFLKMDGSVEPERRQELAQRFNSDPSIDLLILTTQIGGLGLNLTGADVVIFFDHDWNPCRDIQAMDRAHRIGQTKTVNVYRLISQGTLEEKIMRFQKFKNFMADTVIGDENKSLLSMAPDQLIDLLTLDRGAESTACRISNGDDQMQTAATSPADIGGSSRGRRSMAAKDRLTASTCSNSTDDLESTEKQYDKAFNAATFSKTLQLG
ncbi:TATA-binding protein-associated factor [Trichinella pseudospiralis]|uniref:TATA-binding protein-associated factor n=1 Tax=Trichinella pseudospiralis TaxID=6337 RepID=A0A0V1F0T2_TRIPS|nr:TATA-binding protein-associated factor [Trichinella pseudospiralis]